MQLPDSLRNAFQTLGGRTVYDGVGVEPDVLVPIPRASLLEIALIQNNVYFDFANEYRAANEEFDYAELPDSVFQAFAAYLVDMGFTYESRAQRHLNGLRESLGADEPELDRGNERASGRTYRPENGRFTGVSRTNCTGALCRTLIALLHG